MVERALGLIALLVTGRRASYLTCRGTGCDVTVESPQKTWGIPCAHAEQTIELFRFTSG